jgi:hypothetical protein
MLKVVMLSVTFHLSFLQNAIILSIVKLNVILISVMAPFLECLGINVLIIFYKLLLSLLEKSLQGGLKLSSLSKYMKIASLV